MPSLAILRKQMRHTPNLRKTARERPHSLQRKRIRIFSRGSILTLSGAFRCASSLAICLRNLASFEFVDIGFSGFSERHAKGLQQLAGLVVITRAGDNGDIHPLGE